MSTAALTLAFIGQMLGALGGSWLVGRARHRCCGSARSACWRSPRSRAAAFAPSLALLVAAMLVAGVGAMGANASAQAETMRRAGPRRAQALSQYHVWGGAGAAVFPLAVAGCWPRACTGGRPSRWSMAGWLAYAWINRDLRVVPAARQAASPRARRSRPGALGGRRRRGGRRAAAHVPALPRLARRRPLRRERGDRQRDHRRLLARRAARPRGRHGAAAAPARGPPAARELRLPARGLRAARGGRTACPA